MPLGRKGGLPPPLLPFPSSSSKRTLTHSLAHIHLPQKMGIIAGVSCNLVFSILRRQELEGAMGPPELDDDIMPSEMPDGSPTVPPPHAEGQGVGQ